MKKQTIRINLKPLLYLLLGLCIGSLWWTDNADISSIKLLLTGLILVGAGFFYDTIGRGKIT